MSASDAFSEIYGNAALLEEFHEIARSGRFPHALLLHGPRGTGKKLLAKYYAAMLLCQGENPPCGSCRSCRLIAEDKHPDVEIVEHSGKLGGFSVETIRAVRRDAEVLPTESAKRVFLFLDADEIRVQAQNALLKSVEEPPAHTNFVFTAETVGIFLPTLLSRMTAKAVFAVSDEECRQALRDRGFSQEDISEAVGRFGGNIGMCLEFLTDDARRAAVRSAEEILNAATAGNEYELLRLLSAAASQREAFADTLELFDERLCETAAEMAHAPKAGTARLVKMHGAVRRALEDLKGNVSPVLAASALCAALINSERTEVKYD